MAIERGELRQFEPLRLGATGWLIALTVVASVVASFPTGPPALVHGLKVALAIVIVAVAWLQTRSGHQPAPTDPWGQRIALLAGAAAVALGIVGYCMSSLVLDVFAMALGGFAVAALVDRLVPLRSVPNEHRGRIGASVLQGVLGLALLGVAWAHPDPIADVLLIPAIVVLALAYGNLVHACRAWLQPGAGRWHPVVGLGALALAIGAGGCAVLGRHTTLAPIAIGLALSIVAGHVATEALAEWGRRRSLRTAPWVIAGVTGIAASGVCLIRITDMPLWFMPVVLLVLAFVALAAVWSQPTSVALVVLVMGALLWAAMPRDVDAPGQLAQAGAKDYYVVLGDSYMSGEGAGSFIRGTNTKTPNLQRTNECRQAPTAWAMQIAGAPAVPPAVVFAACSGSVTENIDTEPYRERIDHKDLEPDPSGPSQLAVVHQARAEAGLLDRDPKFVIIGIGGNDAGFGDVVATCLGPGGCEQLFGTLIPSTHDWSSTVCPQGGYHRRPLTEVERDIHCAFRRVSDMFPGVPVVVAPYPRPLGAEARCKVPLTAAERRFLNRYADGLNDLLRRQAEVFDFEYLAPLASALAGNGGDPSDRTTSQLCGGGEAGLNFIAPHPTGGSLADLLSPKHWLHNSAHPNEHGHRKMAEVARDWFADHAELAEPSPPPNLAGSGPDPEAIAVDRWPKTESWSAVELQRSLQKVIVPLVVLMSSLSLLAWALLDRQRRTRSSK